MKTTEKCAILFPGVGYGIDRPLLYYSAKLAKQHGWTLYSVGYPDYKSAAISDMRQDQSRRERAFYQALTSVEGQLRAFPDCGRYLFIGKSIGTILAAYLSANRYQDRDVRSVFYTPLKETFDFARNSGGIAFCGDADPWVGKQTIVSGAEKRRLPLTVYPGANHSLETGDLSKDLDILKDVMARTQNYLKTL
ncbi:MAG: alpha/beta hydrolase [Pseudoramibacter sp.]